jgi:malate synthase
VLSDGRKVTKDMVKTLIADELTNTSGIVGEAAFAAGKYAQGAAMFEALIMNDEYEEFLTLPAYRAIA